MTKDRIIIVILLMISYVISSKIFQDVLALGVSVRAECKLAVHQILAEHFKKATVTAIFASAMADKL